MPVKLGLAHMCFLYYHSEFHPLFFFFLAEMVFHRTENSGLWEQK